MSDAVIALVDENGDGALHFNEFFRVRDTQDSVACEVVISDL